MINKTLIIAEAGVNHNGDIKLAKQLAKAAYAAGADFVKYQTFIPKALVSQSAEMADYQRSNVKSSNSQLEMLSKLSLSFEEFRQLKVYCDEIGIGFLSTPFDMESIAFLEELDMPFWKVPSGEVTNTPYLIRLAKTHKPIVMSTGMCDMDEIEFAVKILNTYGSGEITLLHCNTEYPTPFEDVNLRAMLTLKDKFSVKAGYSDHTKGIEIPIAAVALGAEVIEKHFTLDKTMQGPDHKASLEPDELCCMVEAIRNIESALGTGEKKPSSSEKKNTAVARKSIVASREIKKGEIFSEDNLTTKRPGDGISPMKWFYVIGRKAERDYSADEKIEI